MIKYDYVKIHANKKDYYFTYADYREKVRAYRSGDHDPIDCGLDHLREKKEAVQMFKSRKADSFTYSTKEELAEFLVFLGEIGKPIAEKNKLEDIDAEKRYAIERKKRREKEMEAAKDVKKAHGLPFDLEASDLVRNDYENEDDRPTETQRTNAGLTSITASSGYDSFKMYLVKDWGWCVPTLHIGSGHNGHADRAYAVRVSNGECVRVGNGPHVTSTVEVYLKKSNYTRLKPLLELMRNGAIKANTTRDRISTRRMQSRRTYW